jgi:hypothetical protein
MLDASRYGDENLDCIYWVKTLCSLVGGYGRFGKFYHRNVCLLQITVPAFPQRDPEENQRMTSQTGSRSGKLSSSTFDSANGGRSSNSLFAV